MKRVGNVQGHRLSGIIVLVALIYHHRVFIVAWSQSRVPSLVLAGRNGVELLINTKVESINADELTLKGKDGSRTIGYGACVWATGVSMHPLTAHLQQQMPEGTQTHNRSVLSRLAS